MLKWWIPLAIAGSVVGTAAPEPKQVGLIRINGAIGHGELRRSRDRCGGETARSVRDQELFVCVSAIQGVRRYGCRQQR